MKTRDGWSSTDTAALRKARGAFFTPSAITNYIATWAIRTARDQVLEPSSGDARFLVSATKRLRSLAGSTSQVRPRVHGVELHEESARAGSSHVRAAGGDPRIQVGDFFDVEPSPRFDAVIGNPPYIRYQDFSGDSRARSIGAAAAAGVKLSGLASSWAAFTIHSAQFLRAGGRLGLVLPAELLSVNYAAPVRRFVFDNFSQVDLVLFDHQVFPEAEADVVLLLADGYGAGPAPSATLRQAKDAEDLATARSGVSWVPTDPSEKWTSSLVAADVANLTGRFRDEGLFSPLEEWGDTTLGMVTGSNQYFALSSERVAELDLDRRDLLRISPPGSSHLRGLSLSRRMIGKLDAVGKSTYLFRPREPLSASASAYVDAGHTAGVDSAYKCRVRRTWYQVPVLAPADLLLTCMNADTPRLTTNDARVHHLNSVHGVYLRNAVADLGRDLLPLASINSLTLAHAELVGRAYGGGVLKLEPREADRWLVPSPSLIAGRSDELRKIKRTVANLLANGELLSAAETVDEALFAGGPADTPQSDIALLRSTRETLAGRRLSRGKSGR